jgi:hypothetical protein
LPVIPIFLFLYHFLKKDGVLTTLEKELEALLAGENK